MPRGATPEASPPSTIACRARTPFRQPRYFLCHATAPASHCQPHAHCPSFFFFCPRVFFWWCAHTRAWKKIFAFCAEHSAHCVTYTHTYKVSKKKINAASQSVRETWPAATGAESDMQNSDGNNIRDVQSQEQRWRLNCDRLFNHSTTRSPRRGKASTVTHVASICVRGRPTHQTYYCVVCMCVCVCADWDGTLVNDIQAGQTPRVDSSNEAWSRAETSRTQQVCRPFAKKHQAFLLCTYAHRIPKPLVYFGLRHCFFF